MNHRYRRTATVLAALTALWVAALSVAAGRAATLPAGFTETRIATGLIRPTTMAVAPDGRIFVSQQGGALRVIRDGALLSAPFLTVPVDSNGERGLLGVAFDPDFAGNHWVYVYYTITTPVPHNRLSRFTAAGDQAVPGSEVVLLDLNPLSSARNHNGGSLHFGLDGKLYVAVGDNSNGTNSQSLGTLLGKILRLERDGTPPADNPFYGTATGVNRAAWALGLRNPFTFAFEPESGRMFINDVGENTFEEINEGAAGANFGWPTTEGPTSQPGFHGPIFSYVHGPAPDQGCAITGGAFYDPVQPQFPATYRGSYFFADFCGGWIHRLDPAHGNAVTPFATGADKPVDLEVTDDGSLYYLDRGTGSVFRIHYTASQAPSVTLQPEDLTVSTGEPATFTVAASGVAPLRYRWQRNGVDLPGATSASYTLPAAGPADDGALFRAVVANDFGSDTSDAARLTVTANRRPTATIVTPIDGTPYSGGEVFQFSGTASDPEDGELPASAFTWQVDFHHNDHLHPFVPPTAGVRSGSFTIPTLGESSANVFYRLMLTVRDAGGLTHTAITDLLPRKARITLASDPPGLQVTLDGQPFTTPLSVGGVTGVVRRLGAPSPQTLGALSYVFDSWSDGGAAMHEIPTPAADATYTAVFRASAGPGHGIGLAGSYFANRDLSGPALHRVDPGVDFTWRREPAPGLPADRFSVRWTGQVEARVSGLHTFTARTDDGVRLWVGGQLLIDDWTSHGPKETTGTIALVAGRRYDLRLEYFDDVANAAARLSWSAPGLPREVVPRSQLYPYALFAAGSSSLDAGEIALEARLLAGGYIPVVGAAAALTAADAQGKALVLVSASAPAWATGPRFRTSDTPLLVWGTRHLSVLGLTGTVAGRDYGIVPDQTSLRIAAPGHPAAGGLTGIRKVTSTPSTFGWAEGGAGAIALARLCAGTACRTAGHPAVLAYEPGAQMASGAAPGRRAALYFTATTPTALTSDGIALFDTALRWAAGAMP